MAKHQSKPQVYRYTKLYIHIPHHLVKMWLIQLQEFNN